MNPDTNTIAATSVSTNELAWSTFIRNVYGWMSCGLALTAITAYIVIATPGLVEMIFSGHVFWALIIAQFGLVWFLSARAHTISTTAASFAFLIFSALTGATLAPIFIIYTASSIGLTFAVTAGTFGVMSIYGRTTSRDLTGIGSLAFMALLGIIIASIANFWLNSEALDYAITYIGIVIFVVLIAFDTQKLKSQFATALSLGENTEAVAVNGALALYLDFINLFLKLLRIFGKRR